MVTSAVAIACCAVQVEGRGKGQSQGAGDGRETGDGGLRHESRWLARCVLCLSASASQDGKGRRGADDQEK